MNAIMRHGVFATVGLMVAVFATSARAQATVGLFHHFKLPVGSWTNTATSTLAGQASSPPQTTTECGSEMSAAQLADIKKAMRFPLANCTSTVTEDTPAVAEYAQECANEWRVTTTLTKINDRRFTTDTRWTRGQLSSTTHIDSQFNGPCTATAVAPPMMPDKPPPEACAQIASGRDELVQARTACDSMENEAAQCRARVDSIIKRLEIQSTLCTE